MDLVRNNPILSVVRSTVSQDRTRFKDHDTNLDLTYITDNLIAMGFPASGLESAWRNHIDEVANMLHRYHGLNNILIFNLSDRKYDYEKFRNQIVEFGFPDHYSPPLDVLFQIVLAIDNWMKSSPKHVAVVHCMGGKGRTGTVVVCWLMLAGLAHDARSAFEFFASKRSKITKGVTQASQKRYVAYFTDICRKQKAPTPKRFILQRIEISPVPQFGKKRPGCKPRVEVCSTRSYPESMLWNNPFVRYHDHTEGKIVMDVGIKIMGDTLIRCVHMSKSGERVKVFRIAFHTAFVVAGAARLGRDDLDDIKKSGSKDSYGPDFSVTLFFVDDPLDQREMELELKNDIPALYQKLWPENGLKPVSVGQNTPLLHTEPDLPSSPGSPSPTPPSLSSSGSRASQAGSKEAMLTNVPVSRHALMSVNLSPKWDVSPFTIPTTKEASSAQRAATLRGKDKGPSPLSYSQQSLNGSTSSSPAQASPVRSPRDLTRQDSTPRLQASSPRPPSPRPSSPAPVAPAAASASAPASASPASLALLPSPSSPPSSSSSPAASSFGRTSPSRSPRTSPSRPSTSGMPTIIGASPGRLRGSLIGERERLPEQDMPESSSNRLLLDILKSPAASSPTSTLSADDKRERRRAVREQVLILNRNSSDGNSSGGSGIEGGSHGSGRKATAATVQSPSPHSRPKGSPQLPAFATLRDLNYSKPIPSPPGRMTVASSPSASAADEAAQPGTRDRAGSIVKKQLPPTPTLRRETTSKPPTPQFDWSASPSSPSPSPSPSSPSPPPASLPPPPSPHQQQQQQQQQQSPQHQRTPSSSNLLARMNSGPVPMSAPSASSPLATISEHPVSASRFLLNEL